MSAFVRAQSLAYETLDCHCSFCCKCGALLLFANDGDVMVDSFILLASESDHIKAERNRGILGVDVGAAAGAAELLAKFCWHTLLCDFALRCVFSH